MSAVVRALIAAIATVGAAPAFAGAQDARVTRDECTPLGRAVGVFAAREHRWSERAPAATRRLALGRGSVWVVDENRACCPRVVRRRGGAALELTGCSVRSETRAAHVGVVGARRFALARDRPETVLAVAGENLLAAPWRAEAWSAFVRAARAVPESEQAALGLATHVHASLWHGLGVLRDESSATALSAAGLADLIADAHRLGLGAVESRAVRTRNGFDVTLWSSRHAPRTSELDPGTGPGAVRTDELRRTKLSIATDGTILVVEIVAAASDVQRAIAH